jgi:hypothetical protein
MNRLMIAAAFGAALVACAQAKAVPEDEQRFVAAYDAARKQFPRARNDLERDRMAWQLFDRHSMFVGDEIRGWEGRAIGPGLDGATKGYIIEIAPKLRLTSQRS